MVISIKMCSQRHFPFLLFKPVFSMNSYRTAYCNVRSHGSLFYSYDFSFVGDCYIFTVADWSGPHRQNKKVIHDFLHTVINYADHFLFISHCDIINTSWAEAPLRYLIFISPYWPKSKGLIPTLILFFNPFPSIRDRNIKFYSRLNLTIQS